MKPECLNWLDAEKAVGALARSITREFNPDVIVGIARGGLVPAVRLSHLLGDCLMRVIHVKYYKNVDKRTEKPEIFWADVGKLEGKVLVVDDVADTGNTLKVVIDHLEEKVEGEIKIATLVWKPKSSIKPDFYVFVTDRWVIFPWEEAPVELKAGKSDQ